MNAESEKVDPKTDLELGLNCSNQCIEKILNSNSGAGANATTRLETTFVASGPLSELVWSADKGLCVKYADSSFAKNSSHFWDVGPSNVVLAQTRSIFGGISANVEFRGDSVLKPDDAICVMGDIAGTNTPIVYPTSDSSVMAECKSCEELDKGSSGNMDKTDTAKRVFNMHTEKMENLMNSSEKNTCNQANIGGDEVSRIKGDKSSTISGHKRPFDDFSLLPHEPKPIMEQNSRPRFFSSGGGDIVSDHQALGTDDIWWPKVEPVTEYEGAGAPGTNLASSSRSPFEKLESTAESDLQTANCEAACGAISRVQVSKHNEFENKSNDTEMMLQCDKNFPASDSPSNSRIHMLTENKGKEKALSNGDVNVKSLEDDDESHESVESCNSTGMFSMGKKQWNFQQQLIVESKRVKKKIPEASGSKSFVKQDSSFMNWISNMMKGFSQSVRQEANSSALNPGHSDHGHQWPDQKLIIDNKNQDMEPKITGFQSIFQSIYSSRLKKVGTRMSSANHHPGEGSQDFELGDKVDGIDATPITCCAENNILHKPYLQSNEFEGSSWRYDSGPSSQPENEPINFVNSHESSKNDSVEDKTCCYLELGKEKEGITPNSSSDRQNTNNTDNIDSSTISERKLAANISNRGDAQGSLWITRFSRKLNSPLMISDHLNQTHGTQEHSTGLSKLLHSHKQVACLNKCKVEEIDEQSAQDRLLIKAKELQSCSIHKEASRGPKNNNGNNDHKTVHLLNPMSSSSGFRNSEPMASTFARRLDAIKNIMPSNRTDGCTQVSMTCFFCGTRGHQLRDCSEISENDLEDLLKNMNSYMGLEELPCICIKCFQPTHRANACPSLISRGNHELEAGTLVNDCSPNGIQFTAGNAENARLLFSEEEQHISVGAVSDGTDPIVEKNAGNARLLIGEEEHHISVGAVSEGTDPIVEKNVNLKQKSNENLALEDSEKNKLTENPTTSSCSFVERQISDVPKRIFDAVKKLCFSRADILKWKNSRMSISNLDGFFLRLRLGKWEEGEGGTGYYVACINGEGRHSSQKNSRISLSVNVGGIKCMVESQYISNQEFLEDEIMAWWHTISKAGGKIPSEEELMEKVKKKRILGF